MRWRSGRDVMQPVPPTNGTKLVLGCRHKVAMSSRTLTNDEQLPTFGICHCYLIIVSSVPRTFCAEQWSCKPCRLQPMAARQCLRTAMSSCPPARLSSLLRSGVYRLPLNYRAIYCGVRRLSSQRELGSSTLLRAAARYFLR